MRAILVAVALVMPVAGCLRGEDGPAPAVRFLEAPDQTIAGRNLTLRWAIEGTDGHVTRTAVVYGYEHVEIPEGPWDYQAEAGVRDDVQAPATFSVSIGLDARQWIVRAYALIDGAYLWTDEQQVNVAFPPNPGPVAVTLRAPSGTPTVGARFNMGWSLDGDPSLVDENSLRWGRESVPEPTSASSYPFGTRSIPSSRVPGTSVQSLNMTEAGPVYVRALVVRAGQLYWSNEIRVDVRPAPAATEGP